MKTCPNCRCVYPDEYSGDCSDCGKGLGGVAAHGGRADLNFQWGAQVAQGRREADLEPSLKAGRYDNVRIEDGIMEISRMAVKALERAAGRDPDAAA